MRTRTRTTTSQKDWDRVTKKACAVGDAVMMEDDILTASAKEALFELLDELDAKYGPMAELLATRGDFLSDPVEARVYLEKALVLARATGDHWEESEILDSLENLS